MIERLAIYAVLASVVVRWLTGQWPWVLWQARDRDDRTRRARTLLGLDADAGREEIIDAHRRLLVRIHPDRGGTTEAVHEANAARDWLLEALGPANRG